MREVKEGSFFLCTFDERTIYLTTVYCLLWLLFPSVAVLTQCFGDIYCLKVQPDFLMLGIATELVGFLSWSALGRYEQILVSCDCVSGWKL